MLDGRMKLGQVCVPRVLEVSGHASCWYKGGVETFAVYLFQNQVWANGKEILQTPEA